MELVKLLGLCGDGEPEGHAQQQHEGTKQSKKDTFKRTETR